MFPKLISNTFVFLINTVYFICPYIENYNYKKRMTKKINDIENKTSPLSYMTDYKKLTWSEMEIFHSETLENKKSLEDKAKTSLFSISIIVTLIVSFIDLLFKIQNFRVLSLFLVLIALVNLLLAGKMAFDVIGNLNVYYKLFPSDLYKKKKIKKEILAYETEKNVNYNIMRNNHIYLSYKSIMISLIAVSFIGFHYMFDKALTPAKPDTQTEILEQLKKDNSQLHSDFNNLIETQLLLNENLIENKKTLKEIEFILENTKTELLDENNLEIKK